MFLKRVEMQGFKSFADKTIISFEHPITGVVGPNGCGKSNISDAVRWVLGEQSAKSMRGEKMNDVIFSGSADRKRLNMAEVSLVFDNSNHILNDDREEIEVTRRLFRDSGDAEYLINRENVRLRDIVELFLDTGIGRDSLSIISQGNVVSFAESKPLERRGIFEEAAGVAMYKKRKMESLSKLERTAANLTRSSDRLEDLEKQVTPLKRQARRAEIYLEKKKRLEEIEITVLVQDIESIEKEIEANKQSLFDLETKAITLNNNIESSENNISDQKKNIRKLDDDINTLQEELMRNVNEVSSLENRRTELDERRKYIVETGTKDQQVKELKELLDTAKLEYDDRNNRINKLDAEIKLGVDSLNTVAQDIVDKSAELEQAKTLLRNLENRKNVLESLIRNPFNNQAGIRTIIDNKHALNGILGVIGQELKVEEGYEEAIATALGGAMNNIICIDEIAARDAINFLKRNESGRATFLPLTVCHPRYVSKENLIISENVEGYLGLASSFVQCDDKYLPVVEHLLQNVFVVDTIDTGNELSSLTNRNYKIVTLDGEVIHRGGSITGGKTRHDTNIVTMRSELDSIIQQIDSQTARVELAQRASDEVLNKRDAIAHELQEKRYEYASLEPIVEAKQAKYDKIRNDLALLEPNESSDNEESYTDELVLKLNEAYSNRDRITNEIKSKREQRMHLNSDVERKEAQLKQIRGDASKLESDANAIKVTQGKIEQRMENNLQRLASEYQMTYEYARGKASNEYIENAKEEVLQLRADIEHLGKINMNAPEEYTELNEAYETLKAQVDELTQSRDKILNAIDEMDTVMKKQFKEMFDQINHEFNEIFRNIFGGGKAGLSLVDPDDILNSGVDIMAQPPGKNVQNIMLFSGGEKSLIALCVLFAILKVKAVPMVILDEVEAALDPVNVERFAQYLHKYTDRTQFIVVTHRPGTMRNANVLYGVTMQHQGVSQMLKVELREAMDMAEASTLESAS